MQRKRDNFLLNGKLSLQTTSGGWFHTCDLGLKKPKVGGSYRVKIETIKKR